MLHPPALEEGDELRIGRVGQHDAQLDVLIAAFAVGAGDAVDDNLSLLRNAGLVAAAANGGWVLARALDSVTLIDLYRSLGLPLASSLREAAGHPWQARVAAAIQRIAMAERDAFGLKLSELVAPGATPRIG